MKDQVFTPKVYVIQYYNIGYYLFARTESEAYRDETLGKHIEDGLFVGMEGICKWCVRQHINYTMKFMYRKDYPIKANIWNLYSYMRFIFREYAEKES